MKKQILFLAGILSLMPLILMGQNSTVNSGKLKPEQMTGWKAKGLYGNVKTVTDSDGKCTTFNQLGNIISIKWESGHENVYSYTNPYQYTIDGYGSYKITFADNKRIETNAQEPDFPDCYLFDDLGRVIESKYIIWPSAAKETNTYIGSEKMPSKMTLEHYDEMGTYFFTNIYEYISVDSHGNWTKRKVNATLKTTECDENGKDKVTTESKTFYETRTITYYPETNTPSSAQPAAVQQNKVPVFVGGQTAMKKFFADNANPRKPAIATAGYGEVIVEFTVTESGEIVNAKLKGRVSVSMDEEALRLVRMMPKWNPGLINGQPTKMNVQVGLRFFPNQAFRYIKTIVN